MRMEGGDNLKRTPIFIPTVLSSHLVLTEALKRKSHMMINLTYQERLLILVIQKMLNDSTILGSKVQPLTQVSRPPPHLWTNMKTWLQNPFQALHPDQGPNPSLYQDKTMTRLWLIVCPFTPTSTTWWWTTTLRSSR